MAKKPRLPPDATDTPWVFIPILRGKKVGAAALPRARSEIRDFLDRVLAAGREALDIRSYPFGRVYAEMADEALAIVNQARAGDPFKALSPKVLWACATLVELGTKAHDAKINRFKGAKARAIKARRQRPAVEARHKWI